MYFSLGSDVQGLMLPKYPYHIQAGFFLSTGAWRQWREAGIATVAEHVRRLAPVFAAFAAQLQDFQPFFPLAGQITLVKDWARHGLVLSWLLPKALPLLLHSPLLPRVQRRLFFGAPLPPIDPAFSFR